jgi:hypothetical protein
MERTAKMYDPEAIVWTARGILGSIPSTLEFLESVPLGRGCFLRAFACTRRGWLNSDNGFATS